MLRTCYMPLFVVMILLSMATSVKSQVAPKQPPKPTPQVQGLLDRASAAREASKHAEALRLCNMGLEQARALGDKAGEAQALIDLGAVYNDLSMDSRDIEQTQQTVRYYNHALTLYKTIGDKKGEAIALTGIATIEERQERLQEAEEHLQAAVSRLETLRTSLGGPSEARRNLLATALPITHRYIALLLRRGKTAQAFTSTQTIKMWGLLDPKIDSVDGKVNANRRLAFPRTLADIAKSLPADAALLDYIVLEPGRKDKQKVDQTTLFAVTVANGRAKVTAYTITLPCGVLSERIHDLCAARADPNRSYQAQALSLYKLLVAPAARQLTSKKRLIICPDGPLVGLPFQALLSGVGPDGKEQSLEQQFEIADCPTACSSAVRKPASTMKANCRTAACISWTELACWNASKAS